MSPKEQNLEPDIPQIVTSGTEVKEQI